MYYFFMYKIFEGVQSKILLTAILIECFVHVFGFKLLGPIMFFPLLKQDTSTLKSCRASSTFDEDLERMLSERAPRQRTPDIKGEGDVRDLGCPERDYTETAGEWKEVMGSFLAFFKSSVNKLKAHCSV